MKTRNVIMTSAGVLLIGSIVVLSMSQSTGSVPLQDSWTGQSASNGPIHLFVDFDERVVLDGDNSAQALVKISADPDATTIRTPVSMAIVLDTSGSMSGDKIANARRAAHQLIESLRDGDVLTLVGFNHDAYTVQAPTVLGSDRSAVYSAVSSLTASGGTCIRCGMEEAYRHIASVPADRQSRVVVLSDGRGTASAETLQFLAANAFEQYRSPTSAIGLGRDINEVTMGAIATGGSANYYFMHNSSVMAEILNQELTSLENTIASSMTIELNPVNGASIAHTDAFGARVDGNSLIVPVGQLAAGSQRQFLVTLNLPEGDLGEVLNTRVYFTTIDGDTRELAANGALVRSDDPVVVADSRSAEVVELAAWWDSGREVERAATLINEGRREEGMAVLAAQIERLDDEAAEMNSDVLRDEMEEVSQFLGTIQAAPTGSAAQQGSVQFNIARGQDRLRGRVDADRYYENEAYDFAQTE